MCPGLFSRINSRQWSEILGNFIRESLRATGFWSVWLWLFSDALMAAQLQAPWSSYSPSAREALLYQLFVQYEIDNRWSCDTTPRAAKTSPLPADALEDEIAVQMVLPGTDLDRLPF